MVTGAHGGEAQRADAAVRHQGRSKPGAKKIWVQYWGLIGIFPIPGVYRPKYPNSGVYLGIFFYSSINHRFVSGKSDKPPVFWYFG
jgi:hypothetical protein